MEEIIIITSSCFLCAIIGAVIGKSKGHGFMGFMLGLFFGPIGLIIIAVMRPAQSKSRGEELNVEIIPENKKTYATCPYCKTGFYYNSDDKPKCPMCTRTIA